MGGKSQPESHVTTTTTEPPAYVRPYIESALSEGRSLYGERPLYTGPTINQRQGDALRAVEHAAWTPQLTLPALNYARDAMTGRHLGAPELSAAAAPFVSDFLARHNRAWEGAGGTGGSLEAEAAGRGLGNVVAQQYGRERALQAQAAQMAPGLEAQRFQPDQQLLTAGNIQQDLETRRWQEPWERLARYTGIALGNAPAQLAGGLSTGQQPIYQPNPLSQVLGLGLTGLGVAGGLGWRPFG